MAISLLSKLLFLPFMASLFMFSALAHDFSIVGYSPEHLSSRDKLIELFESWLSKHGKIYESIEEKLLRFEVFKDNLMHIDKRNKEISSYWLGLNEFADLSHEEFKSKYLGLKSEVFRKKQSSRDFTYRDVSGLPKSVDWRKKGAVTPVKNQGSCDCDTSVNSGCNGCLMDYAFEFIIANGGLHKEEDYPYLMEEGTCEEKKEEMDLVTISGYHDVPENDEQSLLKALAHQPLSVAIEASGRDFQFYSGGVFNGPCGTELDHGVAAVGYGTSKGGDYIIVKNSWGPKWGEKGYIRMKMKTGKPERLCEVVRSEGNKSHSLSRSSRRSSDSITGNSTSKVDREKEYVTLGLSVVGDLSAEFTNVKRVATLDFSTFLGTCCSCRGNQAACTAMYG
ncbi:hypothetical protein V6N13_089594 [Hibiscus sabdariffa]